MLWGPISRLNARSSSLCGSGRTASALHDFEECFDSVRLEVSSLIKVFNRSQFFVAQCSSPGVEVNLLVGVIGELALQMQLRWQEPFADESLEVQNIIAGEQRFKSRRL